MTEHSEELLPCPWCGGTATMSDPHVAFSRLAAVYCETCEIKGPVSVDATWAATAWNTRSDTALTEALALAEHRRAERDALLQRPIDLAKLDSIDDDATDKMLAYYWWQQTAQARVDLAEALARVSYAVDLSRKQRFPEPKTKTQRYWNEAIDLACDKVSAALKGTNLERLQAAAKSADLGEGVSLKGMSASDRRDALKGTDA